MAVIASWALLVGLVMQASLLGANLFEAVVDVPNWRRPEGLAAYRTFTSVRNAGHFYRVLSPLTILVLLLALALGWGTLARNVLVGGALAAAVLAEAMTVAYFFPRNAKLFFANEAPAEPEAARLVGEWGRANLARSALVALGLVGGMIAGFGLA
mgnify:CR=1 FL=1